MSAKKNYYQVEVSPWHSLELPEHLGRLIAEPLDHDYTVRTVAQKIVNDQPLIEGYLVIAGKETLDAFPLAKKYPLHFCKKYYPTCFHQNPAIEEEKHQRAHNLLPESIAPPIGSTRTSFRSCFLPGHAYDKLSPFGGEPQESNLHTGKGKKITELAGLWFFLENLYAQVKKLHAGDFIHNDLYLHNVIVNTHPLGVHLIDFELSKDLQAEENDAQKTEHIKKDCEQILREAIYIQCALGKQSGALAEDSLLAIEQLMEKPDIFLKKIEQKQWM